MYGEWDTILDEEVDALTRGADLVIVHEFNEPELVGAVGHVRKRRGDFLLLFHDTHHRAACAAWQMARFNLQHYDGVLAYGDSLAEVYRRAFGQEHVWTFHEAADTTVFYPRGAEKRDDVVWIGNWGDEERSREIREYLVDSAAALPELRFAVHGVRYPEAGLREIREAGIDFRGWIANYHVPDAFARAKMTLHIPRGPYLDRLPGIPTIRPFEALACGIPLLSHPVARRRGALPGGRDYVPVRSRPRRCGRQMLPPGRRSRRPRAAWRSAGSRPCSPATPATTAPSSSSGSTVTADPPDRPAEERRLGPLLGSGRLGTGNPEPVFPSLAFEGPGTHRNRRRFRPFSSGLTVAWTLPPVSR